MKLLMYSIKLELSEKSLLIFHFIVLTIVSYIVFQYYGAYNGMLQNEVIGNEYKINIDVDSNTTLEQINKSVEIDGFMYAIIYSDVLIDIGDEKPYYCCGIQGLPTFDLRIEGKELETDSIYIPYSMAVLNEIGQGDVIDIASESYEIAGLSSFTDNVLIFHLETLLNRFAVSNIMISLNSSIITDEDYEKDIYTLHQIWGQEAQIEADDYNKMFGDRLKARKIEALLFFLLGTVCIIFIYSYILSRRVRRFSICSMCGASKRNILFIISIGSFLVFTTSYLLAALIGKMLNRLLFEPIWGYNTYMLKLDDYITFYIIMLIVYSTVTMCYCFNFVKSTSVTIYKRCE